MASVCKDDDGMGYGQVSCKAECILKIDYTLKLIRPYYSDICLDEAVCLLSAMLNCTTRQLGAFKVVTCKRGYRA